MLVSIVFPCSTNMMYASLYCCLSSKKQTSSEGFQSCQISLIPLMVAPSFRHHADLYCTSTINLQVDASLRIGNGLQSFPHRFCLKASSLNSLYTPQHCILSTDMIFDLHTYGANGWFISGYIYWLYLYTPQDYILSTDMFFDLHTYGANGWFINGYIYWLYLLKKIQSIQVIKIRWEI